MMARFVDGIGAESEACWIAPLESTMRLRVDPCHRRSVTANLADAAERILLVDESPDLVVALTDLLIDIGYLVVGAHDGRSALALVRSFRPTAVVLDLGLPGIHGLALAQEIRAVSTTTTRLIALTADGIASSRQRALAVGIDDYLIKPVGIRKLVAVLERGRGRVPSEPAMTVPAVAARRRRPDRADQYTSERYRQLQLALAENIRRLRYARGWTQEDAARRCLMTPRLLQRVEAATLNATMTTLARLCEGFGVDAKVLLSAPALVAASSEREVVRR